MKIVTIAWNKICLPYSEGDLGLKTLTYINEPFNYFLHGAFFNPKRSGLTCFGVGLSDPTLTFFSQLEYYQDFVQCGPGSFLFFHW